MPPFIYALPVLAVIALFVALSLAALVDPRDPALQPARVTPARAARRRLSYIHPYWSAAAQAPARAAAAQPKERQLHMHTQSGVRWLSIVLLAVFLGSALSALAAPVQAAPSAPTAVVNTGRLNVRTGPGVSYTVVTRIDEGQTVSLLARNSAATWVRIRLASGIEGWVNASYLRASMLIADLPVSGSTAPAPTAVLATGSVTAAQLEMRAGPAATQSVVATLRQGQALTLLGRTSDSAWIKVRAGSLGEGWIPAQVIVRLPGDENGTATTPFTASVALGSLPVTGSAPAAPAGPRVSLSSVSVRPATPVYVTVTGFPANRDIAAVLTSRSVPVGFVVATGRTDALGSAQLYFRQPDAWPSGAAIADAGLSLAVGTTDGAVLIWSGLAYSQ